MNALDRKNLTQAPDNFRCYDCGESFPASDTQIACPNCGSLNYSPVKDGVADLYASVRADAATIHRPTTQPLGKRLPKAWCQRCKTMVPRERTEPVWLTKDKVVLHCITHRTEGT